MMEPGVIPGAQAVNDPALTAVVLGLLGTILTGGVVKLLFGWVTRVTRAVEQVGKLEDKLSRLETRDMEAIERRLEKLEEDMGGLRTDIAVTKSQTSEIKETTEETRGMLQSFLNTYRGGSPASAPRERKDRT